MRIPFRHYGLAALFVLATACSSTSTTPSVAQGADSGVTPNPSLDAAAEASDTATTHRVLVTNFAYTPAELAIKVGDTVEWTWKEGTHTVSSGTECTADGKIDSGEHSAPFTFRHQFTEPGMVSYLCDTMEHCAKGQRGVIVVTPGR